MLAAPATKRVGAERLSPMFAGFFELAEAAVLEPGIVQVYGFLPLLGMPEREPYVSGGYGLQKDSDGSQPWLALPKC